MLYLFPLVYYYGDMKLGKDISGIERVLSSLFLLDLHRA